MVVFSLSKTNELHLKKMNFIFHVSEDNYKDERILYLTQSNS